MTRLRRNPIRLGVIGAGAAFTRLHLPVLRKLPNLFRIEAVACRTPQQAEDAARELGGIRACSSYQELLEQPDIDAVLTAVPIDMNHVVLLDAIRSGKHVLAEKPIAATPERAREVLSEITPRSVIAIAENFRYRRDLGHARRLLAEGVIGNATAFQLSVKFDMLAGFRRVWSDKPWRREARHPGGIVLDAGVHAIAFLRDLLGEVAQVFAQTLDDDPALGGRAGLLAQIQLENRVAGQYFACYNASLDPDTTLDLMVYGSRGTLEITPGRVSWSHGPGQPGGVLRVPKLDRGYEPQWRNFAAAIHGEEALVSTPDQAYRDLLVVDAALRSAAGGHAIRVSA